MKPKEIPCPPAEFIKPHLMPPDDPDKPMRMFLRGLPKNTVLRMGRQCGKSFLVAQSVKVLENEPT